MRKNKNVFIEARWTSNQAVKFSCSSSLTIYDKILDECIMALNRIALQERTWATDEMTVERHGEFVAYFEILMKFFPGMDPADVLEVIRVEQE